MQRRQCCLQAAHAGPQRLCCTCQAHAAAWSSHLCARSGMPVLTWIAFTSSEGQGRSDFCGPLPDNAYFVDVNSSVIIWEPFTDTLPSCEPATLSSYAARASGTAWDQPAAAVHSRSPLRACCM